MVETGIIHGRFQIFHLKHLEAILAAKMRCKRLFIGITQPDDLYAMEGNESSVQAAPVASQITELSYEPKTTVKYDPSYGTEQDFVSVSDVEFDYEEQEDEEQVIAIYADRIRNPLTYYERFELIHDALIDFGVKRAEFEIVPFPIERLDYLPEYIPADAVHFISLCDTDEEAEAQLLLEMGMQVEVMWRKSPEEKGISGTDVRTLIALDEEWEEYVPKTVREYIRRKQIDQRIKELA